MLLQATLNGPLTKAAHPRVPVSVDDLVRDARACAAAGAGAFHIHPRDESGAESLDAAVVDGAVRAVRQATGLPVGVSTAAWIEPDVSRRLALIREWREPDYASVNLSERGAVDVMRTLLAAGVGVEAAVWSVADAELLVACGLADRVTRVMIEPVEVPAADAVALVSAIHAVVDRAGAGVPRLQHGDGEAAWVLIEDAVRRGVDTRVGFEDTLHLPDGALAGDNAALVEAARRAGASDRPPAQDGFVPSDHRSPNP